MARLKQHFAIRKKSSSATYLPDNSTTSRSLFSHAARSRIILFCVTSIILAWYDLYVYVIYWSCRQCESDEECITYTYVKLIVTNQETQADKAYKENIFAYVFIQRWQFFTLMPCVYRWFTAHVFKVRYNCIFWEFCLSRAHSPYRKILIKIEFGLNCNATNVTTGRELRRECHRVPEMMVALELK